MTVAGLRRMLEALPPEFDDAPVMLQKGNGWTPAAAFYADPEDEQRLGRPTVGFMPGLPDEPVIWFDMPGDQDGAALVPKPKRKDGAK